MKGIIFDVQRFSVHDGPGIRTTVFMKGCPLRCQWCHNPEGLSGKPQLQFTVQECIGCGRCGKRTSVKDAENCPTGALKVCGKEISCEDLLCQVLRDLPFYRTDGGVTFSGGECLMQADFVSNMLQLIQAEGVTTAVDTSGCVPWESIMKTVPFCDLYLYDIKAVDSGLHKAYTGVDNALILTNITKLSQLGKRIWVRIPVIPGVNDSEKEMAAIAQFLIPLQGIEEIRLLPYHTLGKSKYETLGMVCKYNTDRRISEKQMQKYRSVYSSCGLPIAN